jgi:hypothetical protein
VIVKQGGDSAAGLNGDEVTTKGHRDERLSRGRPGCKNKRPEPATGSGLVPVLSTGCYRPLFVDLVDDCAFITSPAHKGIKLVDTWHQKYITSLPG